MNRHESFLPGVAAILLAILFPIYWITVFGHSLDGFDQALELNLQTLSFSDLVFVFIGGLEIYIYLSLQHVLRDKLQSTTIRVLLYVMAVTIVIFHSTILIDLYLAFSGGEMNEGAIDTVVTAAVVIAIGAWIVYSLVALVLAILLMVNNEVSAMLKAFAVLLIILCVLQLTIIFAFSNVILFPIALIVLAVYFLKGPNEVEVV